MNIKKIAFTLVAGLALMHAAQATTINASCTDCPLDIPPGAPGTSSGTTESVLNVGDTGTITDVDVFVNLTHTFNGDLDIFLQHNMVSVELSTDNGGAGDNYTNTIFDDEAAVSIATGVSPFTGSFQPEGLLSTFDGFDVGGDWKLVITDDAGGDVGQLLDWGIVVEVDMGSVPAPAALVLLLAGLAGVAPMVRRRRAIA